MALLGKISAVLTASTADFTRKIGESKKEIESLRKQVSGTRLSLDSRALDGTLTRLQKFKRLMDEVQRIQAAGNGPFVDTRAMREQFRLFEDIGRPLTDLKNKIEGLSTAMQAGLYPELEKIQQGFTRLYNGIESGSVTLASQTQRVDNLRSSLIRLSRAAAAASDLGGLSQRLEATNSGASFSQAGAQEALKRTLLLREQAASLPARFRSDAFADLAVEAEEGASRIEQAAARVLAAQLEIARSGESPGRLLSRAAAQEELNNATRRQRAVNVGFERQIKEGQLASIVSRDSPDAVDELTKRVRAASSELRQINSSQFEGLIKGAVAAVRTLNSLEAAANRARMAVGDITKSPMRSPEDYFRRLDYSDVRSFEVEPNESGRRYADALSRRKPVEVDALVEHLREQFNDAMKKLGMTPSEIGKSQSWATWDVGKQLWMNEDPTRSGPGYRTADPFTDANLQREMVARMVGYEILQKRAADGGGEQRLSSAELAKLGQGAMSDAGFTPVYSRIQSDDVETVKTLQSNAKSLEQSARRASADAKRAVSALEAAARSSGIGRSLANETKSMLFTDAELRRQQIEADYQAERNGGDARAAAVRREASLAREMLNRDRIPNAVRARDAAAMSGDEDLRRLADESFKKLREIDRQIGIAEQQAGGKNAAAADAALKRKNELLAEQGALYQKISQGLDEVNAAQRQQEMFLEASGGRGELLSQGARDAAADISTARQFRGQVASGAARIAIQAEIDQVTTSVTRLQREIVRVANSNLGSREKIAELDRLDNEIRQSTKNLAKTVAQYSGGAFSEQQVAAAMRLARNTAGSISTRGAASAQLAIQQGLFAIDDLISSTGGLEYKLRAVGNNITQLGLLLGQSGVIPGLTATTGLFIGLATVLGGQAISAIVRWYNEGRTAEDQTKALNDALARQRSLVDGLAQAFGSLGDSIAGRAFSRSGEEARQFQRELAAIDRQQRELREARLVDNDSAIGVQRANQNRIRRQLEGETDVGRRIVLQRQLDESQRIERRLADERLAQPAQDGAAVRQAIQDLAAGFADASSNRRTVAGLFGPFAQDTLSSAGAATAALPANLRNQLAGADFGNTTAAIESQIRALDAAIGFLTPIAEERTFLGTNTFGSGQAQEAIQSFTNIINALRNVRVDRELDDAARRIFEVGNLSARRIEEAQNSVAEAIEAGIPGARAVERRLNSLGNQLQQAFDDLKEARAAGPDQRTSLQANAQARIDRIRRQQVAELVAADSLRRESTLNPERQVGNVISRIESAISSIGSPAADIQGRLRELQFERESIRQQRAGIGNNPFAARRLDNQEQALTLAIRSLEDEVNILSEAFNGFNREVDNRLRPQGDATRGLDRFETPGERARRELEQTLADIAAAADALEERVLASIAPNGIPLRGITDEERNRLAEIERRRQQADDQTRGEQMRANAPAIFGLADSVANAVLQGPSRAALNVSDISTQEGARELNRLLRGEDSNRDNQNLIELQRQSAILEEMLRDVRNGVNNVAAAR